ncbi:MAG: site-specific integrase, partial [Vicinamibacteria bacterium]|nr:site-specific integrase [Vicinamibacteria bacterium]
KTLRKTKDRAGHKRGPKRPAAAAKKEKSKRIETVSPFALAAIRLLVFTGARASEVLGLTWDSVDLEAGRARLPDSKTGAKTVFLPAPAVKLLKELPRLEGNPYVIPGGRKGQPLTLWGVEQVWQVIRRRAGLVDVRLHDLRHSFASMAAADGQSLPVIGALLGHSQAQTTKRYAHLSADPLKAASDAVASRLASAMRGGAEEQDRRT